MNNGKNAFTIGKYYDKMKIQGKVLFHRKNSALPPKKAGQKTLLALATEFLLSEKSDRGGSRDCRGETPEKKEVSPMNQESEPQQRGSGDGATDALIHAGFFI